MTSESQIQIVAESPIQTVEESCKFLRMGRTQIYKYLGTEIPVIRYGRSVRIYRTDLVKFALQHRQQAVKQANLPTSE